MVAIPYEYAFNIGLHLLWFKAALLWRRPVRLRLRPGVRGHAPATARLAREARRARGRPVRQPLPRRRPRRPRGSLRRHPGVGERFPEIWG